MIKKNNLMKKKENRYSTTPRLSSKKKPKKTKKKIRQIVKCEMKMKGLKKKTVEYSFKWCK